MAERGLSKQPLLLGCSGGPDSKALLYLLEAYCRKEGMALHVAHVDHGWRSQSRDQALELQKEVEGIGLNFHLKTIDFKEFKEGNLENQGRDMRLEFFSMLYTRIGAQALLLGHHADDRAEIVLKRLFEGASLSALGAFGPESELMGMRILRPLIRFSKKKIIQWIEQEEKGYFLDETNESSRFLRGRMRSEMLPYLSASFGKEISANLSALADEAQEIALYFSQLNRPLLRGQGNRLDLSQVLPLPTVQLRYLLKEWWAREGVVFSREILNDAVRILLSGSSGEFLSKSGIIKIERMIICLDKLKII